MIASELHALLDGGNEDPVRFRISSSAQGGTEMMNDEAKAPKSEGFKARFASAFGGE
jgi:hypothetical protein